MTLRVLPLTLPMLILILTAGPATSQLCDAEDMFAPPSTFAGGISPISATQGSFTGPLSAADRFGWALDAVGDLDGDGVVDLAVGTPGDDDGGSQRGAVWVLFLNPDGTVKDEQKISDTSGGFDGVLDSSDFFGSAMTSLGDINCDGVTDIAVSARLDDDGGDRRGAVWVLMLNTDGTVNDHQKISDIEGGFTGDLDDVDLFGYGLGALGDLDGDQQLDLAAGAQLDDDGGTDRGAVWILFLDGSDPCSAADLAEPFCVLDFSDVVAFLSAFGNEEPAADLAAPVGTFDFSDVVAFLAIYGAGCP